MSRNARSALLVLLALLLFLPAAWTQTNEQLSFQGRLTDDAGNPVTGSVDLTFRLYDAPTGGTEVWSETQLAVPVSGGIYNVMLRGADWGSADFTAPYWLSVEVASDGEMTPRYALAASPYALRAKASDDADTLGGQAASAFAAAGHGHDHGTLSNLGADAHTQYALLAGRAAGQTLAGGSATTTTLTLAANTADAAAAELFLNYNGYVGIGTTNPTRILDLWFTTGQGHSGLGLKNIAGDGRHYVLDVADNLGNPGDATGLPAYAFGIVDMTALQTRFVIDPSGNVAIGKTTPTDKLDVNGGVTATSFTGGGAGLTSVNASQLGSQGGSYYLDLSNHTGTLPLANGGTGATAFAAGSVIFSNGSVLTQNNANLFWDNANARLGIGSDSPPSGRLYLTAASGYGLYGHMTGGGATSSTALFGRTDSTIGFGVYGYAAAATGTTYGVYGIADSAAGWGLYTPNRLYAGGNVGIGTTAPYHKLHVRDGAVTGSDADPVDLVIVERNGHACLNIIADPAMNSSLLFSDDARAAGGVYYDHATDKLYVNAGGGGPELTLDASGQLGIGTTSPGAKLEVAGQVKITGGSPGADKVLTSDAAGLASWATLASLGSLDGSGTASYIPMWTDTDTLGDSNLYKFGTYVGINTTAPTRTLDLWFTTGQGHNGLGLRNIAGAGRHYVLDVADDQGNPGDATGLPPFGFGVVDMTVGLTRLVIDAGGKVGLGVREPYELLHVRASTVADSATADDPLVVERNSHAHLNIISATDANGGVLFSDTTRAMGSLYYNHLEDKMHFNTGGTGPRMTIDAAGQLGIGTTSPTSPLTVAGTIETTSGGVKFPDATVQATAAFAWPQNFTILSLTPTPPVGFTRTEYIHLSDDAWATKTSIATARYRASAGMVDDKIYVAGGYTGSVYLATCAEYDPSADSWTSKTSMTTARSGAAAGVVNGRLYVIGGYNGSSQFGTCEEYDPTGDAWSSKNPMSTSRYRAVAGVVNGRIYVIGGYNGASGRLDTCEEFNPGANAWAAKASMPTVRDGAAAGVVNGRIYVIGGYHTTSGYLDTCEEYDPGGDSWSTKTPMPTPRDDAAAAVVNGRIYVIGGYNSTSGRLDTCEEYDPSTDTWTSRTSMPTVRAGAAAGVVNGRIYVIGGYNGTDYLTTCEEYTPPKGYFVYTKD